MALLLSLFLVLLVFFVMLNALSAIDAARSKDVADSLVSAFSQPPPPGGDTFVPPLVPLPVRTPLLATAKGLVEAAIPAAKVKLVLPGELMEARFETEALFFPGTARLRPAQGPFLDRLVAAMSVPVEGQRLEMDCVIGARYLSGTSLPTTETLEVARVGALAREMWGRGLPSTSFLFGLEPGDPHRTRMTFRAVADKAVSRDGAGSPHPQGHF